jgi:hypothetical protein
MTLEYIQLKKDIARKVKLANKYRKEAQELLAKCPHEEFVTKENTTEHFNECKLCGVHFGKIIKELT